jgi:hypothetical protein
MCKTQKIKIVALVPVNELTDAKASQPASNKNTSVMYETVLFRYQSTSRNVKHPALGTKTPQ